MKWHAGATILMLTVLLSGCTTVFPPSNPFVTSNTHVVLLVENRHGSEITLQSVTSNGTRGRIGSVRTASNAEFMIPWSRMSDLRIELSAAGGGQHVTRPVVANPGDRIRLRVPTTLRNATFF